MLSEYKYIIFFTAFFTLIPIGTVAAILSRRVRDFVFMFLIFGTTQPGSLFGLMTDINFLSREWYRGTTRGIEISYLDLLAIILLVSSIVARLRERDRLYWPVSLAPMLAFVSWATVNVVFFSEPKIFGVFELTKMYRAVLLFLAVAWYVRGAREVRLFIWALIGTIYFEAAYALRDRYWFGYHRIQGTIGHPNSLSMYALQTVPLFVVTAFSKDVTARMRYAALFAYGAAAVCVILTISRMGFVALIGLSGVTFLACTGIQWDRRKLAMAAAGLALGAALVGKGYRTNLGRLEMASFEDEYLTEGQGRGQYFRQAAPAIAENPITGVGLNNWSYWMTNKYNPYYASRGDYMRPDGTRSTTGDPPAHNYYLLMVTELGWPGLFLCLALLFTWLISNGLAVFNRAEGLHAYLRMGVALSLLGIMMQSWTEWIFLQTHMWFLGHTTLALGAALYYQRQRAVALGRIPKSNVLRLEPAPPVINYG